MTLKVASLVSSESTACVRAFEHSTATKAVGLKAHGAAIELGDTRKIASAAAAVDVGTSAARKLPHIAVKPFIQQSRLNDNRPSKCLDGSCRLGALISSARFSCVLLAALQIANLRA